MDKTQFLDPGKGADIYKTRFEETIPLFEENKGDIFGDCVIEKPIGMGGAASVYRALHTKLDTFHAIKILKAEHVGNIPLLNRFIREARIAASLNHPGIVHVYDTGEKNGKPYIEMEYVEGSSLRHLISERGVFSIPAAFAVAEQVADALAYAHSRLTDSGSGSGIIHRDIKPENILVRPDGQVKIVDFGIAKAVVSGGETIQGAVLGTYGYMPIEQIDGKDVDARSDLYSLTVVLYEMLAGALPYKGETNTTLIKNIMSSNLVPLRKVNNLIPREIESMVHKGLSIKKEDRFQDAGTFSETLRKLNPDKGDLPARVLGKWLAGFPKPKTKKRKKGILFPVFAVILICSGAVLFMFNFKQEIPKKNSLEPPNPKSVHLHAEQPVKTGTAVSSIENQIKADSITHVSVITTESEKDASIPTPLEESTGNTKVKSVATKPSTQIKPKVIPKQEEDTLANAKELFEKEDYFNSEKLFNSVLNNPAFHVEASYYLVRIMDARFRFGQVELKDELKGRWQRFIQENTKLESSKDLVKDAKERFLYVISH